MVSIADGVVVITGGRRGLGSALVDEMLHRGAAKVYSTARQTYTDPRSRVFTHALEVSSDDSVTAFAAIAPDATIVVNNAGISLPGSLLESDLSDVVDTFDVNVLGPLRVTRAFAPILEANGGGALLNLHSVLSWLGGAGAYGASKAALWSITNSLRLELMEQRTQVLGVHAAFIDTDMVVAVDAPKTSPREVARKIADALEQGASELLVDATTEAAKAALTGPVEDLVVTLH